MAQRRISIRLSIGDGVRFGIGLIIAPLALWIALAAIGMASSEAIVKLFPPAHSTTSGK